MEDKKNIATLTIMAHSDSYDRLYQVASMALTAAHTGRKVNLVFFFWALRALVNSTMDEMRFSSVDPQATSEAEENILSTNNPPPSEMLAMACETGLVTTFACSASLRFMGLDLAATSAKVDQVVGLATIQRLTLDTGNIIYI